METWMSQNTINAQSLCMTLYRSSRKNHIVRKRPLQLDYRNCCLIWTGMSSWIVVSPSMGKYWRLFSLLFKHVYYITGDTQDWWDICVGQARTILCKRNIIGCTLQKTFIRIWRTAMNATKTFQMINDDATYNYFRRLAHWNLLQLTFWRPLLKTLNVKQFAMVIIDSYSRLTRAIPSSKTTVADILSLCMESCIIM